MSRPVRIATFGSAGALVASGAVCAVLIGDGTGEILGFVLVAVGLVAATSLVFLEIGLGEDRDREREREAASSLRAGRASARRPRRLPRSRGHRRTLD